MSDPRAAPTVVIMAAGEGTRMRSALPKALHEVCGRPMVAWPVIAAREAGAGTICVVVAPERDISAGIPDGAETVVQPVSDGTGGALRAVAAAGEIAGATEVVVLSGDHPLVSAEVIAELLATHRSAGAAATVMTVELDEPGAYGRVVRDSGGAIARIVETKHLADDPDGILAIREVNVGTYCFDGAALEAALPELSADNAAGEYYLTDVLELIRRKGLTVAAHLATDPTVNLGVNDRADLAVATAEARRRIVARHLASGVTIADPASTWIDADVEIEPDATIEPATSLRGRTRVAAGAVVGPLTTAIDAAIGPGASVVHSYLVSCEVGAGCSVGPFAYLRPGAVLERGAKAGTFVEVKNSTLGEGAKVPHLSYVGDADVGEGANLGAGTITANYDGVRKHRTEIGPGTRIGVNNSLVAPVEIGAGAYTGAGAVIRKDVPEGALGVTAASQRNIDGYARRRATGSGEDAGKDRG